MSSDFRPQSEAPAGHAMRRPHASCFPSWEDIKLAPPFEMFKHLSFALGATLSTRSARRFACQQCDSSSSSRPLHKPVGRSLTSSSGHDTSSIPDPEAMHLQATLRDGRRHHAHPPAKRLNSLPSRQSIPLASGLFDVTIRCTNPAREERRSDGYPRKLDSARAMGNARVCIYKRSSGRGTRQVLLARHPTRALCGAKHLSSVKRRLTSRLFILKSPAEQAFFYFNSTQAIEEHDRQRSLTQQACHISAAY